MLIAHASSWAAALVLFATAWILLNKGKARPAKAVQMVLRLFYLLTFATGVYILFRIDPTPLYYVKAVVGIIVISLMEMVLVKKGKNQPAGTVSALFAVFLAAVLYLGYKLPLSM